MVWSWVRGVVGRLECRAMGSGWEEVARRWLVEELEVGGCCCSCWGGFGSLVTDGVGG